MTGIVNTSVIAPVEVFNTCKPANGPSAVPVAITFTALEPNWDLDLQLLQQQAPRRLPYIQSLYLDNANNDAPVTVFVPLSQQRIIVPPRYQGYVGLLSPNPPKILLSSVVSTDTVFYMQLLDFPISNEVWNTDPTFSNVPLNVTDPVLDALLVNGYLPTQPLSRYNGDVLQPNYVGTRTATGVKTTTGATPLVTPAAFYRLTGATIMLSGDAALAAPGVLTVQLRQNTTVIATFVAYLPGAAGTPATPTALTLIDRKIDYWSTVSAENLNLNFSAALTVGTCAYTVEYAETTTQGP